jgi:hypothetical protein
MINEAMSEDPPADVLSSLPRTRPHRRSEKRGARQVGTGSQEAARTLPKAPAPAVRASAKAPAKRATGRRGATAPKAPETGATGRRGATAPKAPATRGTAREARATRSTARKAPSGPKPKPLRQPEQPAGGPPRRPPASPTHSPAPVSGTDILGTAVQAAAELAEIGLSASARALRAAISRLPRP